MSRPPVLARWLVRIACPPCDLPHVLGDLDAEFALRGNSHSWYSRQALRSLPAVVAMGLRRWDWECSLLAIFMSAIAPILFMEAWWRYILCQIPLKADSLRGADFALLSLLFLGAVSVCAGTMSTPRGLWLAVPLAWLFVLLGGAATHNTYPAWFHVSSLTVVAFALAAGAWVRRKFDHPSDERRA
ncbi:MAG: hypothetical protein ABI759_26825 [Candidatus Solibacter sp.]